jgi:hypothetical protein
MFSCLASKIIDVRKQPLVGFIKHPIKKPCVCKTRKMLMIAILLPLLFKSHTFWPPKTQFHRKCHQRIEKYLEPEVHSSHQSGKYQVLER